MSSFDRLRLILAISLLCCLGLSTCLIAQETPPPPEATQQSEPQQADPQESQPPQAESQQAESQQAQSPAGEPQPQAVGATGAAVGPQTSFAIQAGPGLSVVQGTPVQNNRHVLFDPAKGKTAGLIATVYSPSDLGPGYHRWRVEITRSDGTPFAADGMVIGRIQHGYIPWRGAGTEFEIPLSQGATQAVREVHIANWSNTHYWNARFNLDGTLLEGLNSDFMIVGSHRSLGRSTLIVTSPGAEQDNLSPNSGSLNVQFKMYEASPCWSINISENMVYGSQVYNEASTCVCWASRFPKNWLDLASFDLVTISQNSLLQLGEEQRACLRAYLLGGGVVAIHSVDDQEAAKVKASLGLRLTVAESIKRYQYAGSWATESAIYNAGMGRLLISTQKDLVLDSGVYHTINNISEGRQSFASLRGTNDEMVAGVNYWNWLIPNVGKPPIWSFVAFIGLFAGVAGPGLLYLTMRARRPSWLLFLFPALALIVTCLLVGYAVIHDGFTTVARVRSFTFLDQGIGQGFTWGRQTTFSGSPPRQGLKVPADCELSPMNWTADYSVYRPSATVTQRWNGDSQSFLGLLKTREQQQVLYRMPVKFNPISIQDAPTPIVKNLTTCDWDMLILRRENEELWLARNIKAGGDASLQETTLDSAVVELQKRNVLSEPKFPDGLVQGQQVSMLEWASRSNSMMNWGGTYPLMEEQIRTWASRGPIEHSYMIISKTADHLPELVPNSQYSDSFHVMVGTW